MVLGSRVPPAPRTSPLWSEPGQFLACAEMAVPDVSLAQGTQGSAFAALVIVISSVPPGDLAVSGRGQSDAQPFPPCPLWMPGEQLGASSPFSPLWGQWVWEQRAGSHAASGMAGHQGAIKNRTVSGAEVWEACYGSAHQALSCQQEQHPCPIPAWPCLCCGSGQSGHVVAWRLALPRANVATLSSRFGCVPGLAGAGAGEGRTWQVFSSRLSSLAVLGWQCPMWGPGLGTV